MKSINGKLNYGLWGVGEIVMRFEIGADFGLSLEGEGCRVLTFRSLDEILTTITGTMHRVGEGAPLWLSLLSKNLNLPVNRALQRGRVEKRTFSAPDPADTRPPPPPTARTVFSLLSFSPSPSPSPPLFQYSPNFQKFFISAIFSPLFPSFLFFFPSFSLRSEEQHV